MLAGISNIPAVFPDVTVDRSTLTVERVTELALFDGLRQEWDELLQASDSGCVFLTWEWLSTWWRHLAEGRSLFILIVRRSRKLVALAPFCLRPRSLSRARPLPEVEFLGSGFVGSDYLDIIVRQGDEAEAYQALAAHLGSGSFSLKWTNVKKGENAVAGVLARLGEKGWTTAETATNVCPFIPLAGRTWESYMASLSAEHRYNFHRKWRRLSRDYVARFEQTSTAEQCRDAVGVLIAQHNTRWRDRGGSDAFHTPELIAFHHEFTQIALTRGWLRLYVLRLNEKPAACLYGLLHRGVFSF